MSEIWNGLLRQLMRLLLFFLPERRKIAIERWYRGREEYRRLRVADYVLVSWAKSGRTWLRIMLSHFYQQRYGLPERSMLGFDNLKGVNRAIPSVFFTHGNYLRDFTGHHDTNVDFYGKRIIMLVRDPRDIAVSQFFQWKYRMRPEKKLLNGYPADGEEVSIYDFVMQREAGLRKIVRFLNLWARELPRLENILVVRYEDMRADPEGVLGRILEFMGSPASAEEIRQCVSFASYENMKKLEEKNVFRLSGKRMVPGDRNNPDSFKTRRAKVGGYRDYFEHQQVAEIESYVNANLSSEFGYVESVGGSKTVAG